MIEISFNLIDGFKFKFYDNFLLFLNFFKFKYYII